MAELNEEVADDDGKKSRDRSPNHPILSLPDALSKAEMLHAEYGRHLIPVARAHSKWGYKEHGGIANQCVAALKAYGLLNVHGQGKDRKLEITDTADRIIRKAPDRGALLKQAAKTPPIHTELLEEYASKGLPPDDILRTYLVWERLGGRFNEGVVDAFIERFRKTLEFSGLDIGSQTKEKTDPDTRKNGNGPETPNGKVQVGSFVQWTSQDVEQFSEPQKVTGVDGDWAFVEGSETGLPMSELTVLSPPTPAATQTPAEPPRNPNYKPPKAVGPRIEFTIAEGNVLEIQLTKPVSKKDFDRIKKLLELSEDSMVVQG